MPTPWTTSDLRKLGRCIRDGVPPPEGLPRYSDVMLWYNELAAFVQKRIASHDWSGVLSGPIEVTSRPKTLDTLREKLQRDQSTPLQNIQDVAGVRFEAEMTLGQQDLVVAQIVDLFAHDPKIAVHDLRDSPHSGYRAVHIWLKLDGRVEVQVRTHLQGEWANMYESAADRMGRGIRYDQAPTDAAFSKLVDMLRNYSIVDIAEYEQGLDVIHEIDSKIKADYKRFDTHVGDVDISVQKEEARLNISRVKTLKIESAERGASMQAHLQELKSIFNRSRARG